MFSNQTPNYGLPQYEQNDTLNVLNDFNGAMEAIDSTMKTNELAAASAQSKADGADTKANNNATAIGDLQTAQGADRTDINTLTGSVNTINSLIGNGEPTTTDKTLIGAINELHSDDQTIRGLINNGNWRVKTNGSLTATGDGVKTFSQLLDEMYASLAALQASLPTTQAIVVSAIYQGWGIRGNVNGFEWLVGGGSPDSYIEFQGFTLDFVSTNVTFFFRVLRANGSEYRGVSVASDNTVTYNDYSANILNADEELEISYTIYEQA